MAMEFQQSFVVKAPADKVWAFLTDPRRAASAMPGAALTEQIDEHTFAGTVTVKVGPVTTQYKGQARFERLDPAERTVEMVGSGQDVKGRGGADLRMTSRLSERAPGETEVSVVSQVTITGILAQFGRGMIQDVSDRLFERFTAAVRAELETGDQAGAEAPATAAPAAANPPLDAVELGTQVAGRVLSRWARQPVFWLVIAALAALFYFLVLR